MRIFLYVTGILILLLIPFAVKAGTKRKIFMSFFLGFVGITFLINIEFFSSPNHYGSPGDVLIYFINWAAYIVFGLICSLITFIKPENRKEYFFFFLRLLLWLSLFLPHLMHYNIH